MENTYPYVSKLGSCMNVPPIPGLDASKQQQQQASKGHLYVIVSPPASPLPEGWSLVVSFLAKEPPGYVIRWLVGSSLPQFTSLVVRKMTDKPLISCLPSFTACLVCPLTRGLIPCDCLCRFLRWVVGLRSLLGGRWTNSRLSHKPRGLDSSRDCSVTCLRSIKMAVFTVSLHSHHVILFGLVTPCLGFSIWPCRQLGGVVSGIFFGLLQL